MTRSRWARATRTSRPANGNKTISAGNGNNYVHAGTGTASVTLGNGNDNVQLGGGNDTVTLGNGNDYVTAGNGNDNVTVGNGNDNVQLGDGDNVVIEGNGNDYVKCRQRGQPGRRRPGPAHHPARQRHQHPDRRLGDRRQLWRLVPSDPDRLEGQLVDPGQSADQGELQRHLPQLPVGRQRPRLVLLPRPDNLEQEIHRPAQLKRRTVSFATDRHDARRPIAAHGHSCCQYFSTTRQCVKYTAIPFVSSCRTFTIDGSWFKLVRNLCLRFRTPFLPGSRT